MAVELQTGLYSFKSCT